MFWHDIIKEIPVELGQTNKVTLVVAEDVSILLPRTRQNQIEVKLELPNTLTAPIVAGDAVGLVRVIFDGQAREISVTAKESIEKIGLVQRLIRFFSFS